MSRRGSRCRGLDLETVGARVGVGELVADHDNVVGAGDEQAGVAEVGEGVGVEDEIGVYGDLRGHVVCHNTSVNA